MLRHPGLDKAPDDDDGDGHHIASTSYMSARRCQTEHRDINLTVDAPAGAQALVTLAAQTAACRGRIDRSVIDECLSGPLSARGHRHDALSVATVESIVTSGSLFQGQPVSLLSRSFRRRFQY